MAVDEGAVAVLLATVEERWGPESLPVPAGAAARTTVDRATGGGRLTHHVLRLLQRARVVGPPLLPRPLVGWFLWHNIRVRVRWAATADKHGYTQEHVVHAFEHAELVSKEFQEPRPPSPHRPWLLIGRPSPYEPDRIEVLFEVWTDGTLNVFHVMRATPENLALIERSKT